MKNLKDIRLLFVEDELLMQKSIEKILAKHIKEFRLAVNGEERAENPRRNETGHHSNRP
ncbi:MAG: hypothetical protein LRY51_12835 [Geovibrio sp.]|nr:hypothetical protein [Geovibrio sp.]